MVKITLLILAVLSASVYAGIIEYPDDDRYQTVPLDCPGADSVVVGFSWNASPYIEYTMPVPNSIIPVQLFEFIQPDRDERGRVIPGHYEGDYYYFADFWIDGLRIASPDTFHVSVNYDIGGGCGASPVID